ncbi:MAG: rod-binding protein [Candidatus Aureabacteria bacterium]|nr:rod-binding protein [Candidatus Auribacterota bacterium]
MIDTLDFPLLNTNELSRDNLLALAGPIKRDNAASIKDLQNLGEDSEGLKKACNEFEAIFIHQLLQEFRKSVPKDGFIPRSFGVQTFEEMLDRETASKMSKTGDFGIGKALFLQLSGFRDGYKENDDTNVGISFERKG